MNFKQDNIEYAGNNCFIPASSTCFINRFKNLTGRDFMEELLFLVPDENRGKSFYFLK